MPTCSQCGFGNSADDKFCQGCGQKIARAASPAATGGRRVRIGREADNDLVIGDHQQVSRHHVTVTIGAGGQLTIEDTGTRNGTKVDGRRIQGPTPITLHSEIKLGSYLFNTAMLHSFMQGGGPSAGLGRPGEVVPATGGGYKRVPLQPLDGYQGAEPDDSYGVGQWVEPLMTRAFQGRRTWLGGFTLFSGIFILVLFFVPMAVTPREIIFPFSLIGKRGIPEFMQVCLVLMPIYGITLIVLRSVNLGNLTYSIALCCSFIIGLGFYAESSSSFPGLPTYHGWHIVMSWMLQLALCGALLFMAAGPKDLVARILVAVFAGLVILFFIVPATGGHKSQIYLVSLFKATKFHGALYLIVIFEMSRLILVGLCFMFMSAQFTSRRRRVPQAFAIAMFSLVVIQDLVGGIAMAAKTDQGTWVMLGLWSAFFTFFAIVCPAIGMAGLFTGLRRRV